MIDHFYDLSLRNDATRISCCRISQQQSQAFTEHFDLHGNKGMNNEAEYLVAAPAGYILGAMRSDCFVGLEI